jgi:homoserine kinase type II
VLKLWNLEFLQIVPLNIPGSPERASDRFVIEDNQNRKFILEKHHFWNKKRKTDIAINISFLKDKGYERCQPYLVSANSETVEEYENRCWMVQPYIENDPLKRPDYLDNAEMGRHCAHRLIELKNVDNAELIDTVEGFCLKEHTENLIAKIEGSRHVKRDISKILAVIRESFLPRLDSIDKVFSHGDLHPMNILWKNNDVKVIIDWEFSGFRHQFTDVANLIGCLGFEHPTAFKRDFYLSLMAELDKNDYFSKEIRENLFLFVFGFRFSAWLNEWHKKNDEKMVELELEYLEILLEILNGN